MMFGLATFALSMWNFAPITHDWGWRELLLPQALRGFAQQFTVAIGIAACATLLNDRTNLHFLRLAEHLTSANAALDAAGLRGPGGLHALWALVWREAQTQTYADAFWCIMLCFVIATLMVPLMRKVAANAAPRRARRRIC